MSQCGPCPLAACGLSAHVLSSTLLPLLLLPLPLPPPLLCGCLGTGEGPSSRGGPGTRLQRRHQSPCLLPPDVPGCHLPSPRGGRPDLLPRGPPAPVPTPQIKASRCPVFL